MKILTWNCRGLGNPDAVRAYKRLLRSNCPDVVFLMETKLKNSDFNVSNKLCVGYLQNHFIVNCNTEGGGRSGGLALIWHNDVQLHITNFNNMLIEFYVLDSFNNNTWYASGLYGYPTQSNKHITCETIKNLYNSYHNKKWLLFGDFNLYLNSSEKLGGKNIDYKHCNLFNSTLNDCDLLDLGYHGNKFTWANNQESDHHIKERLDRYCANPHWINYFPRYTNFHLLRFTSDHSPILLEFWDKFFCRQNNHKKKKIIKFEELWSHDKESFKIVKNSWNQAMGDSAFKGQATLHQLHVWGHQKFGDIPNKIRKLQETLGKLKDKVPNNDIMAQIVEVEKQLNSVILQEEVWWAQRAKTQWLKYGDYNTKFFHFKASQRKKKNTIYATTDNQGVLWQDLPHIHDIFINHFKDIFSTSNPIAGHNYLDVIKNRITNDMMADLNMDFTPDEVVTAMKTMKSTSSPGPDGLPALFYQTYWHLIGNDVTKAVLHILNNGGDPSNINHTYITLIPKTNNPTQPSEFRPISLCNVILKIVTKTIANRVKRILPYIISNHQSAFISNRLITDNILVSFEAFHKINKTSNSKKGLVGIKLDMAKAYDRIEWGFLNNVLLTMGFPNNMVSTIMKCVSTVSFSILINGQPTDSFIPQRGLRQGDPLSPYLFILCAEVLSGLLTKGQTDGSFHGVIIAPNAPPISHLFFADDSLLFL